MCRGRGGLKAHRAAEPWRQPWPGQHGCDSTSEMSSAATSHNRLTSAHERRVDDAPDSITACGNPPIGAPSHMSTSALTPGPRTHHSLNAGAPDAPIGATDSTLPRACSRVRVLLGSRISETERIRQIGRARWLLGSRGASRSQASRAGHLPSTGYRALARRVSNCRHQTSPRLRQSRSFNERQSPVASPPFGVRAFAILCGRTSPGPRARRARPRRSSGWWRRRPTTPPVTRVPTSSV